MEYPPITILQTILCKYSFVVIEEYLPEFSLIDLLVSVVWMYVRCGRHYRLILGQRFDSRVGWGQKSK